MLLRRKKRKQLQGADTGSTTTYTGADRPRNAPDYNESERSKKRKKKGKSVWRRSAAFVARMQEYGNSHNAAQPFIRSAFISMQAENIEIIKEHIKKALKL